MLQKDHCHYNQKLSQQHCTSCCNDCTSDIFSPSQVAEMNNELLQIAAKGNNH